METIMNHAMNGIVPDTASDQKLSKEHINLDELKYLSQVREIIEHGKKRTDRTGTGTLSIFGMQSRYDLRGGTFMLLMQNCSIKILVIKLTIFVTYVKI